MKTIKLLLLTALFVLTVGRASHKNKKFNTHLKRSGTHATVDNFCTDLRSAQTKYSTLVNSQVLGNAFAVTGSITSDKFTGTIAVTLLYKITAYSLTSTNDADCSNNCANEKDLDYKTYQISGVPTVTASLYYILKDINSRLYTGYAELTVDTSTKIVLTKKVSSTAAMTYDNPTNIVAFSAVTIKPTCGKTTDNSDISADQKTALESKLLALVKNDTQLTTKLKSIFTSNTASIFSKTR
jgi:hypothetical protein